jgi:hypothetical protein
MIRKYRAAVIRKYRTAVSRSRLVMARAGDPQIPHRSLSIMSGNGSGW